MNAKISTVAYNQKRQAMKLIVLFGLVSLCADMVYEGGRSVNGPYLKTLAANAAMVGLIAGIGEFLGYGLRIVSGYFSDKTRAYWIFTFSGYGLIVCIPLLSLTGVWQMAAILITMERIGKALRSPARDTILSSASKQVGTGFGFGLHEALDQVGAILGPLIFTFVFVFGPSAGKTISDYQKGYGLLWIPLGLMVACLILAYQRLPRPQELEVSVKKEEPDKLSKVFWLYTTFTFITTLGFVNFVLLGYHFKARHILSDSQIPLFYALAMGIDALVALAIGKAYDVLKKRRNSPHAGLDTLIVIPLFSLLIPICAFSQNYFLVLAGVFIWGIVMGAHETIMRSSIADITPLAKRGSGYGIFNAGYGLAMFLGSALMGVLYEHHLTQLILAAVFLELLSLPIFFLLRQEARK